MILAGVFVRRPVFATMLLTPVADSLFDDLETRMARLSDALWCLVVRLYLGRPAAPAGVSEDKSFLD